MSWKVENPQTLMVEQAYNLFNNTPASELPIPSGLWGIDDVVWQALLDLTEAKCNKIKVPLIKGSLKGWCIWASVVAAKFYAHKFRYGAHVVRVCDAGDHYFAVLKSGAKVGICDITCNQFAGPNYIAGWLADIKGTAKRVKVGTNSLYDAYALGARSETFVV